MKRGAPLARGAAQLKRSGFKPAMKPKAGRPLRSTSPLTPVAPSLRSTSTMARLDAASRPAPKTVEIRKPTLLAMAKDRPCLLGVPSVCNFNPLTTVACHSNQSVHGKAGARKADDHYSVWGCFACHTWLDQEGAPYEVKVARFEQALAKQIECWRVVAADPTESTTNRKAARWALFQHGIAV
jgi:hypothetical protein